MKKKIAKRSLALGALMAFVITGSAMAEQIDKNTDYNTTQNGVSIEGLAGTENITFIGNDNAKTFLRAYETTASIKNVNNIILNTYNEGNPIWNGPSQNSAKEFAGNVFYANGSNAVLNIDIKGLIESEKLGAETIGFQATSGADMSISADCGINIDGGMTGAMSQAGGELALVSKNGDVTIKTAGNAVSASSSGISSSISIDAKNVVLEAGSYGVFSYGYVDNAGGSVTINAENDLKINAEGAAVWSARSADTDGIVLDAANINIVGDIYATDGGKIEVGTEENLKSANIVGDVMTWNYSNSTTSASDIDLKLGENGSFTGGVSTEVGTTSLDLGKNSIWNVTGESTVTNISGTGTLAVSKIEEGWVNISNTNEASITVQGSGDIADTIASGDASLQELADTVTTTNDDGESVSAATTVATEEGEIAGAMVAQISEDGTVVESSIKEATNTTNKSIGEAAVGLKLHNRAHLNDMNKRMGELRDANGEHGVWVRMVRGEQSYEGAKAQYNQYQLGYDEKLSTDKRWTVGAAVTFAEGDSSFKNGSTEDDSTAFAIYGSKLNDDGTFVDLIARIAHLESDVTQSGQTGDYSTNGYSVSAEFGKRIQQGKGLWIEPQVELTYGTIDSADYVINGKKVHVADMDSLIGRVGFRIGKDIKQGNVYARASYLYDFEGETDTTFSNGNVTRTIKEDLGGGWWEVGVGTNINLSKSTYIYADVEKTFGGDVDIDWQWNLGVRYSF